MVRKILELTAALGLLLVMAAAFMFLGSLLPPGASTKSAPKPAMMPAAYQPTMTANLPGVIQVPVNPIQPK